jgi:hypothetical protein
MVKNANFLSIKLPPFESKCGVRSERGKYKVLGLMRLKRTPLQGTDRFQGPRASHPTLRFQGPTASITRSMRTQLEQLGAVSSNGER